MQFFVGIIYSLFLNFFDGIYFSNLRQEFTAISKQVPIGAFSGIEFLNGILFSSEILSNSFSGNLVFGIVLGGRVIFLESIDLYCQSNTFRLSGSFIFLKFFHNQLGHRDLFFTIFCSVKFIKFKVKVSLMTD